MADCIVLRKQAAEAYTEKDWERAAALYTDLSDGCAGSMDNWDWFKCGQALRHTGQVAKAMEVARWLAAEFPEFIQAKSLYAWCLFDTEIKLSPDQIRQQENRFIAAAQKIVELTEVDRYSVYTPFVRTARKVVDFISQHRLNPDEDVLAWTEELDPEKLSAEVRHYTAAGGRQVAIASDREWWYTERSKALFNLERFQECLDLCENALTGIPEYRDTDLWFRRRRALCRAQIGQVSDAIEELKQVRDERPEWFVEADLARLLDESGRKEEALMHAAMGALEGPVEPHRWRLYLLLASLYRSLGQEDLAREHATLALRAHNMEHSWPFGPRQEEVQKNYGVELDGGPDERALARKLQPLWGEVARRGMPEGEGRVQNIQKQAAYGYIERNGDGGPLYFNTKDWKGAPEQLEPGTGVRFRVARVIDRDRNVSEQAIEVTPVG